MTIVSHIIFGWITLWIVNLIPGINVPINLITALISGIGGIFGTIVLIIFSVIF